MYLRYHLISCVILTIILFPFFNYLSFLVFLFGFFIDFDHYLYDAIKNKNLNLFISYKTQMNHNLERKDQLHIFHTIEFILPFLFLVIISRNIYLIIISLGLLLHLILDYIYEINLIRKKIELKQTRAFSFILWIKRNLI
jgi:hypothetical protein